eukprot:9301939-Pyramimonas_sp.AAC.1
MVRAQRGEGGGRILHQERGSERGGGGAEKMMPNGPVVKSGGSVARLEQGPLRGGRITRHGIRL